MRCNHCGAEWTLPYNVSVEECPFCKRKLEKTKEFFRPGRNENHTPQVAKRDDFDIVGTVLRAYKGTDPVVYVPEGITELGGIKPGRTVFAGNKMIEKVILPKSLRKLRPSTFCGSSVREVVFAEGLEDIPDYTFAQCTNLRQISLPSTVQTIGNYVFWGCSNLEQVTLSSNLKEIGNYAFYECSSLRQIDLPDHLEIMGKSVFENTSLDFITIPGSVKIIPERCFFNCKELESVDLQKGIEIIKEFAFSSCTSLTDVVLPDGTSAIRQGAFKNCYYLERLVIPNSVTHIESNLSTYGPSMFYDCKNLRDVTWPVGRFSPHIFVCSGYHGKAEAEHKVNEARRQAAAQKKRAQDEMLIRNGICPKCNVKFAFLTKRCRQCGTKY